MGKFIKDGVTYEVTGVTPSRIYYVDKLMNVDGSMKRSEFEAQRESGEIEVI